MAGFDTKDIADSGTKGVENGNFLLQKNKYDDLHNIVSKTQNRAQNKVSETGALKAGYVMNYNYNSNNKHQLDNVTETEYRTKNTDPKVDKQKNNKYVYDANGNMIYVNTEEVKVDGKIAEKAFEKKMLWDEENRLGAVSINGYVSSYSYDAGGERITKMSGGGQGIFVNSAFSGGKTSTSDFTLYVNPYLVAQNGGRYTKHIYIGSQRIVSKIGDFDSYGADPRRVEKAGESFSGVKVDYDTKYKKSLQTVKANYASLDVPYYGLDNNDYVNGLGFCCNPSGGTASGGSSTGKMTGKNDNAELQQFYYHPDHLGSSSYISNLDGEVVQHVEYVPFGEVFLEEKNAKWNTPYLFTSKELDRETGMYYFGARYQDPKLGIFISVDPLAEKYTGWSSYNYTLNNPLNLIDPDGNGPTDWYKNTKTGNIQWFNGSTERKGYENLGKSINVVAGTGQALKLNSNGTATDMNSRKFFGANRTIVSNSSTGETVRTISQSSNSKKGTSYGVGTNTALGGGFGVEVGLVKDSQKNWGAYFTFKTNYGVGQGVGISTSQITPTHNGGFLLDDFNGTGIEASIGVNTPLGGGGVSFGGTSPQAEYDLLDRLKNIGTDKRGYITGGVSPELSGPSAGINVGAMISETTTWVWDF